MARRLLRHRPAVLAEGRRVSQSVMVEVSCDAANCGRFLRESHWVALPLASMMKAKLRRENWLTVKGHDGLTYHFCASHRECPEPDQPAVRRMTGKRMAWRKGTGRLIRRGRIAPTHENGRGSRGAPVSRQ